MRERALLILTLWTCLLAAACVSTRRYGPARPMHYQNGSTGLERCTENRWVVCLTDYECAADLERNCEICRCASIDHSPANPPPDPSDPEKPPGIP